jgi:ABC-type transport system involved in cytochrome c biogenesis permease subunit
VSGGEPEIRDIDGERRPGWWVPWAVAAVAAVLLIAVMTPRPVGPADSPNAALDAASKLPVVFGGRLQPLDSVAANSLLAINGKRAVDLPHDQQLDPVPWLLDVLARPSVADTYPTFRVDHPALVAMLQGNALTADALAAAEDHRYAYADIAPHLSELAAQAQAATQIDRARRSAYQRAVLELGDRLDLYLGLRDGRSLHAIPPAPPDDGHGHQDDPADVASWMPLQVIDHDDHTGHDHAPPDPRIADAWLAMLHAHGGGDAPAVTAAARQARSLLAEAYPAGARDAAVEAAFNHARPFFGAMLVYLAAGLVVLGSWLVGGSPTLRRSATALVLVALVVHTLALAVRVHLTGRPPVTNLYGSSLFVGWGVVVGALILERVGRDGIALLCGATAGVATLLVAHQLAMDGDTMAVLQAVLDTNFWLATHVIVITLGYSAVYLAGLLGIVYIFVGTLTRALDRAGLRRLTGMIYGTCCFALLASFVGTVLGGIWADQSWGRFWGWDPKENGALLIVLHLSVLLHARLAGWIAGRGIALLAVFGNIVTTWSWFGVNMLGAGLHSYGFMDSAVFAIAAVVLIHIAIIAWGSLPLEMWRAMQPARARKPHAHAGASPAKPPAAGLPAS